MRAMCKDMQVPLLGQIPLDPNMMKCCDAGKSFVLSYPDALASSRLKDCLEGIFLTSFSHCILEIMGKSDSLRETWSRI